MFMVGCIVKLFGFVESFNEFTSWRFYSGFERTSEEPNAIISSTFSSTRAEGREGCGCWRWRLNTVAIVLNIENEEKQKFIATAKVQA